MRLLDLFSGCGGASEGYRQVGIEVAVAVDNWDDALRSHAVNHIDTEHLGVDLSDPEDFTSMFTPGEFDIIHGSPPCQNFSNANNSRDPEKGMELVRAFETIIQDLKPDWFVMENVPSVIHHVNGLYPKKLILNAADFGTPQTRKRLFAGRFLRPLPTHGERAIARIGFPPLVKWVTVSNALGLDGVVMTPQTHAGVKGTRHTSETDRPSPTVTQNWWGAHILTTKELNRIAEYERKSNVINTRVLHPEKPARTLTARNISGRTNDMIRMHMHRDQRDGKRQTRTVNKPSPTIMAKDDSRAKIGTDDQQRLLTVEECAILQGFPDHYIFTGTKTSRYRQIGNAVPPQFSRAIGLALTSPLQRVTW